MSSLQFNLKEDSLYSPISPGVIDISSNSGDEFLVEPGNVPQLEERSRINHTAHDAMTTFMGAATAMLFPANDDTISQVGVMDTTGTGIEQELMELIEESRVISSASPTSFIDSEFEETNESPEEGDPGNPNNTRLNNYGRPTAAFLPTPRRNGLQTDSVRAPLSTYPLGYDAEASAFHPHQRNAQDGQNQPSHQVQDMETANVHVMPTFGGTTSEFTAGNMTPLIIQLPPRGGPDATQGPSLPLYPGVQWGFPFHVVHSPNILSIPIDVRRNFRLFPTVMPNVAGHCDQ